MSIAWGQTERISETGDRIRTTKVKDVKDSNMAWNTWLKMVKVACLESKQPWLLQAYCIPMVASHVDLRPPHTTSRTPRIGTEEGTG